ncbi:MAG: MBL fold metallo-hydrolase RNA specificity domain-containing protein [Thermoplasmata archaeon]
MNIGYERGIVLREGNKKLLLDPSHQSDIGIVTHGHLDHLVKDAYMTPHTLDILEVRLGERRGKPVPYGEDICIGGFEDITLSPAGHVFGSAMISVGDILYTGDFNTLGGMTCGKAEPRRCETLIIETTYGKKKYRLPPKNKVEEDLKVWTKMMLNEGPVVFGAYEFGKAQETIAILNSMGKTPSVPKKIADICDIYRDHGVDLEYRTDEPQDNFTAVVTPAELKKPSSGFAGLARKKNGNIAYLSGWCAFYSFFRSKDIDAQFPLSDHAGFDELMEFVEKCDPEEVLTVHGSGKEFCSAVEGELGIHARPLK